MSDKRLGRKRLPEGTRAKDQFTNVIVKVPKEIFEQLQKLGTPSEILRQDVIEKYQK